MFNFTKKQYEIISSLIGSIDLGLDNGQSQMNHIKRVDPPMVRFFENAIIVVQEYKLLQDLIDTYVRSGGDAWLKPAARCYRICLRSLRVIQFEAVRLINR